MDILISISTLLLAGAIGALLERRRERRQGATKRTNFNALSPPGSRDNVHARTLGPPVAPVYWNSAQFREEFEAHIAGAHLSVNSQELLTRAANRYCDDSTQDAWELWLKAIALTNAKLRREERL